MLNACMGGESVKHCDAFNCDCDPFKYLGVILDSSLI